MDEGSDNTLRHDATCPSSRAKVGAHLLGVRQNNGTVAILPTPLPVDKDFLEKASKDSVPLEQRFRFSNKCVEGGCKQWNGSRCTVADKIVDYLDNVKTHDLPACSLRPTCRWYEQQKEKACLICPLVVTDVTDEDILSNPIDIPHE